MKIFPFGLMVAILALAIAMSFWQIIVNVSMSAMGLAGRSTGDPLTFRRKIMGLAVRLSIVWILVFGGLGTAAVMSAGGTNVWFFACFGAVLVPAVVFPRLLKILREPIQSEEKPIAP